MSAKSEIIVKIQQLMSNLPNCSDNSHPNMMQSSFLISSTSNIDELQLQNMITNDNQQFIDSKNGYYQYNSTSAPQKMKDDQIQHIDFEDSDSYQVNSIPSKSEINGSSLYSYSRINSQQFICKEKGIVQIPEQIKQIPNELKTQNHIEYKQPLHKYYPSVIILDQESNSIPMIEVDQQIYPENSQQDQQSDQEDEQYQTQYEEISDSSLQIISNEKKYTQKNGVQKTKRVKKCKSEKTKFQEYLIIPAGKKCMLMREKRAIKNIIKDQEGVDFSFTKPIFQQFQFFLFCDIVIEHKAIIGNQVEQTKRSDANFYKSISHTNEFKDSNLFEIILVKTRETQMQFDGAKQYLLSLQDQYAKQVYDSLQNLEEKTRMGVQTAMMIHSNQASLEYIIKRKEYASMKYEEFKCKTLPNLKYYIYNHYVFDIKTGNIGYTNIGMSKDFLKILAINPDYFQVMMKKYGIIDFLKKDYKTAFTISYFNQYAYNMRNFPKSVRFSSEFITLDNIEIKVDIEHQLIDLCKEFDEFNNFDCPFTDFVGLIIPQISDEIVEKLSQIREEQNIDIEQLMEMNEDEIDFYYNNESQQFIKKYYSDIQNRDVLIHNLKQQKLDFTSNLK